MGIKSKLFGKTSANFEGIQEAEMADARKGIIFFLGNTECQNDFNPTSLVGDVTGDFAGLNVLDPANDAMNLVRGKVAFIDKQVGKAGAKAKSTGEKINEQVVNSKVQHMLNTMQNQFNRRYGPEASGLVTSSLTILVKNLTTTLTDAIPVWGFVNDASGIYSGLKQAGTGVYNIVEQTYAGWGVELLNGHPSTISKSLARHTTTSTFSGLSNAALNGTKLGFGIATGGISKLADVLIDIFLAVWKFFDRLIQVHFLKRTLGDAKLAWKTIGSSACFANHHNLFSNWYRDACIKTPVIAALSICSGFAGNPMRFLHLIKNNEVSSASSYSKGCKYIDIVKSQGGDWVRDYCDQYSVKFEPTSSSAARADGASSSMGGYMGNKLREIQMGKPVGLMTT